MFSDDDDDDNGMRSCYMDSSFLVKKVKQVPKYVSRTNPDDDNAFRYKIWNEWILYLNMTGFCSKYPCT